MTRENCGFQVYHMSYFYGLSWEFFYEAYDPRPEKIAKILGILSKVNTTVLHFNNNYSKDYKLDVQKPVAYTLMAQIYCPKVYKNVDKYF